MLNSYRHNILVRRCNLLYTVYKHTNKLNNKVYIGITSRNPISRWGKSGSNYTTSPHFYSAICKYGWDNFNHIILYTGLTKEEACAKEIELIAKYQSTNPMFGYNMTSGGDCYVMSAEIRGKISNSLLGNKNGLGIPCSKEKAEKISKAQIGKIVPFETRRKQSESAHNRHVSCSEEKRKHLQDNYPHMRSVYCVETDKVYKSVQSCARELNLFATSISKVCKGKLKTTGGYHLKYYDDMINA